MQRFLQIGILALLPLSASCLGLAAGAGFLISQDVSGNKHVSHVSYDVDRVWPATQAAVREMAGTNPVTVSSGVPRMIKTRIEGRDVTITVEAYDVDQTLIKIEAWMVAVADPKMAESISNRIIAQLAQR